MIFFFENEVGDTTRYQKTTKIDITFASVDQFI